MTCEWTFDEDTNSWNTECGNKFVVNDGTPYENGMIWCCYCGNELEES